MGKVRAAPLVARRFPSPEGPTSVARGGSAPLVDVAPQRFIRPEGGRAGDLPHMGMHLSRATEGSLADRSRASGVGIPNRVLTDDPLRCGRSLAATCSW